ncbi:MAG TPA: COX15/CtaA family protein [Solirubrobacteraceae bacterium]|nr:COX15/CtaA family protein [Solirubrobacteraceae bacterium]
MSTRTAGGRLEPLRERTNGFTVTPPQCAYAAYVALAALTVIVLTGAAVRLSGSGLGCPTWPKCYGNLYPPLRSHAVIEFSNRVLTAPVCIAAGLAWLAALRRRPYRRDLMWLSALLPLGVIGQAVLGGLTVRGELDYGWVMAHFALSMLIIAAAVALVWRAGRSAGVRMPGLPVPARPGLPAPADDRRSGPATDRALVWATRALVGLGALTLFAGTAATAAGPHAGGSPGQKINRLSFDGRGTMDFVIHRHAEIAFVFSVFAVVVWWLARRRGADPLLKRSLTTLCILLALQGAVGLDQYETHLPTELVWVHVTLASVTWIATLWSGFAAAGRQAPAEPAPEARAASLARAPV